MRGFNQAAYLAERLSQYTGIPAETELVEKVRKTKSQKKLNAIQRRKNLEAAFRVKGHLRGRTVLVVDDVYTTGSTVEPCSLPEENGAGNVYFLTVCTGRR